MKKRFEEINPEHLETVNFALRNAIKNAPNENDQEDGLKLLSFIEEKQWFGKIEYPMEPIKMKCSANIRKGVFHSMAIYVQFGKWRFTRTEFNKTVDFGRKNGKNNSE